MIKVLVVDDSALILALLGKLIAADPALMLVGAAPDAFVAREMVIRLQPDVITLDIEMPKVDGPPQFFSCFFLNMWVWTMVKMALPNYLIIRIRCQLL